MSRPVRFVVFNGEDGYRWHAKSGNNRIVATSGEAFASKRNAVRAAESFVESLLNGDDLTLAVIE